MTAAPEIGGRVALPDDPGWDEARRAWNLTADQRPAMVVFPEDPADVAATLRFAAVSGLRVAPQAVGHGALTLPPLDDTILLSTSAMRDVTIDPSERTATFGAGAPWSAIVPAAGEHGLAAMHGSSGAVSATGYLLGGGLSWLARRNGWACNHVRAFDVVTPAGDELTVDHELDADLFWALRGGGSSGVVVAGVEIDLFPLERAYAGAMLWPLDQAAEIIDRYRDWAADAPVTVTSMLKLLRLPPVEALPEALRGKAFVAVMLAVCDDSAAPGGDDPESLVAPLRGGPAPVIDGVGWVPVPQLSLVSMDPPDPSAAMSAAHLLFDDLDDGCVAAMLELAGPGADPPVLSFEVRHLGGALALPVAGGGARGPMSERFSLVAIGMSATPEQRAAVEAFGGRIETELRQFASNRSFLGFSETRSGLDGCFDSGTVARLREIRHRADPDGLIVGNHG